MINYKTACEIAGFTQEYNPPKPIYSYFAYKNGEALEFIDERCAKAFSKLVERVTVNQAEIDNWKHDRYLLEVKAFNTWFEHLREEYWHLNDAMFNLCYNKAYDAGHSVGYDEVAREMSDIVDFVCKIMDAQK